MIIDIHTHAWPNKIAQKAREHLENLFLVKLVGEPTIDTLTLFMDKNKIDISVVSGVATRPEQVPSINNWLCAVRSKKIKIFCALHPEYEHWKEEVQRISREADGIKLQPEFQNFYIDDEKVFPMYEEVEKRGIPILFHCGEELSGTRLVRSSPKRMAKVRKRFPRLTIIAGHFGGFRIWDEVEEYLLGSDIYFDTSFFLGHLPEEKIINLISRHPSDRLLFGTDFPLIDQKKDLDYLKQLKLPRETYERILYRNAQTILKITEK